MFNLSQKVIVSGDNFLSEVTDDYLDDQQYYTDKVHTYAIPPDKRDFVVLPIILLPGNKSDIVVLKVQYSTVIQEGVQILHNVSKGGI